MAGKKLAIKVPEGLKAGDEITLNFPGSEEKLVIELPEGAKAGEMVDLSQPEMKAAVAKGVAEPIHKMKASANAAKAVAMMAAASKKKYAIKVPEGKKAGDTLSLKFPGHTAGVIVTLPEGAQSGEVIEFLVPPPGSAAAGSGLGGLLGAAVADGQSESTHAATLIQSRLRGKSARNVKEQLSTVTSSGELVVAAPEAASAVAGAPPSEMPATTPDEVTDKAAPAPPPAEAEVASDAPPADLTETPDTAAVMAESTFDTKIDAPAAKAAPKEQKPAATSVRRAPSALALVALLTMLCGVLLSLAFPAALPTVALPSPVTKLGALLEASWATPEDAKDSPPAKQRGARGGKGKAAKAAAPKRSRKH